MYYFDSRVRYSEVDRNGILDFTSAIQYMQDCSIFHSEDIGKGITYLKENACIWLLNSWQIQVNHMPQLGEDIRIGTWAHKFEGIYGYRNFVIDNKQGRHLLEANSIWVYYDSKKGRPLRIDENAIEGYLVEPALFMEDIPRKIKMPDYGEKQTVITVKRAYIDTNVHVNNSKYIQIAQEFLPDHYVIQKMRAQYCKSALLGDRMIPEVVKQGGQIFVSLLDEENHPYVIVEFQGAEG